MEALAPNALPSYPNFWRTNSPQTPSLDGDPGPIRTGDLPLRRGTLYPAELRGHWQWNRIPRLAERTNPPSAANAVGPVILCDSPPLQQHCRHMMIVWEGLSAIGDSRALLPLVAVLVVFLPAMHRPLLRRWTLAIVAVAGATLASKIAFMGWGLGVEPLDFTGISGHAAMSSAVYPVALWLLACGRSQRAWNWALAGMMLAVAIAISRLPLKAHSLSEILSGLGLGIVASIWVLRRSQALGRTLAVRIRTVVLAIVAAIGLPFLLADLHTHDLVKAAAKALSGRERALDRHDLRNHASPTGQHY